MITEEHLRQLSDRYAKAWRILTHMSDDSDYPLEAHASHLLASLLTGSDAEDAPEPIREALYWQEVKSVRGSTLYRRSDIWIPPSGSTPEWFIELKIARLQRDSVQIGGKPAQTIINSFAEDVWLRLSVLSVPPEKRQNVDMPVGCSFVVVVFGDFETINVKEDYTAGEDSAAERIASFMKATRQVMDGLDSVDDVSLNAGAIEAGELRVQALAISWNQRFLASEEQVAECFRVSTDR